MGTTRAMSAATSALGLAVRVLLFAVAAWWAYDIRLIAIKEFGECSWCWASVPDIDHICAAAWARVAVAPS